MFENLGEKRGGGGRSGEGEVTHPKVPATSEEVKCEDALEDHVASPKSES